MSTIEAFVASNRFGLGARPGELARIAGNPRAWLRAQIDPRPRVAAELALLGDTATLLGEVMAARRKGAKALKRAMRGRMRKHLRKELAARTLHMVRTPRPFAERWLGFWSNHFTVSTAKPVIAPTVGAYEREAIRPHMFGPFEKLLGAVVRHPTMLMYLDNAISVGENSTIGRRRRRGLNENLARELLELHTLGVDGGYSQHDVRELARILTGWSHSAIGPRAGGMRAARAGAAPREARFRFYPAAHEPGSKTLLGKSYREAGEGEGEAALAALARHPATARFIAIKLARHFVADLPPPAAVRALEASYRDSDGDLGAVARTLIELPEAWNPPLAKLKTPYELVVSTLRATAVDRLPARALLGNLRELGQLPLSAPSPAGWPDTAADWMTPEGLMRRLEWLHAAAARLPRSLDPQALAMASVGPVLRERTTAALRDAPGSVEALTLVFASPEFQRR